MNTSTMRFKVLDNHILDIRYFQYFYAVTSFQKIKLEGKQQVQQ